MQKQTFKRWQANPVPLSKEDQKKPLVKESAYTKGTGRNEPCPCGSGKKYKFCHFTKQQPQAKTDT